MPETRKATKARRRSSRKIRISWYFHLTVILFCAVSGYVAWLDFRIQSEFVGKKWSLPARVYASPVEIFIGQELTPGKAEKLLLNSGYGKTAAVKQPGDYLRAASYIEFKQREFHFWDGRQDSRHIRIRFNNREVKEILDLNQGRTIPLIRLEPALIGRIYPDNFQDRILVAYADVPPSLIHALLAVEDRHYFRHSGIDFRGMLRALYRNIFSGRIEQGGSTITQQLVKNFFLDQERTITRKINEIIMALLIERRYGKEEILAAYINEVYLGQQGKRSVHGFGTAAEFYFARPLDELRLDQVTLLVGMVKGASFYNPRRHPDRAKQRRDLVLDLMFQQGHLDESTRLEVRSLPLDLSARPRWVSGKYPAFLQLVKSQLLREYDIEDLRTRGMRIFTTLDTDWQDATETALARQLQKLERAKSLKAGTLQAASIFVQTSTGAVLSLAGGRNAEYVGFNRAMNAKRPIGSLIKPFVYYTALTNPQQYSLVSKVNDGYISIRLANGTFWRPDNYDGRNHGQVSLMEALAKSYNKATVRLGREIGLEKVIAAIKQAGVDGNVEPLPSVLLGSLELTPLQVTQIYQTLANSGFFVPVTSIREVLDKDGRALRRYALEVRQALQTEAAFLTSFMLVQTINHGTGRGLHNLISDKLPMAGKTGTTNDLRDSWFAGFGDDVTGVVWLGRDDNQPTRYTGASGAMQIWGDIVKRQDIRHIELLPPPGTGLLSNVKLPFGGACITFPAIPYVLGARPGNIDAC